MKKRLLAAVLAAALALGFSACTLNVNRSEYLDFINSLSETAVKGSVKIEIVYSRGAGPLSQAYIAQGSGVIYEQEAGWYYALTNNHVVAEDPEFPEYTMIVYDCYGNMYEGSVVDSSAEDDLAVVKFPAQEDFAGEYPELKIIGFADDNPDTGDVVASARPTASSIRLRSAGCAAIPRCNFRKKFRRAASPIPSCAIRRSPTRDRAAACC